MKRNRKELEKTWWHIYDKAFSGTGFTKSNSRFMGTNSNISPGTVFDISKSIVGKIKNADAVLTYKSLIKEYPEFPTRIDDITPEACRFTIRCEKENDIEMASQLLDVAALSDLSVKGGLSIQNGMELIVIIDKWGMDFIEEAPLMEFLENLEQKDPRLFYRLHDGDNYVATKGIWVEGISIEIKTSHSHKWTISPELKTALECSPKADISFSEKSSNSLQFSTRLKYKSYPFLRLRRIKEKKNENNAEMIQLVLVGIKSEMAENIDVWAQNANPEMFA